MTGRFAVGRHHRGAWPAKGWSLDHLTKARLAEFYKVPHTMHNRNNIHLQLYHCTNVHLTICTT